MRGPVELIQYLPAAQRRPRAWPPQIGCFRFASILKCQNSGTPEFWWSIFFASKFLRKGWIAGSSPAMTAEAEAPLFCIHSTEICFSGGVSRHSARQEVIAARVFQHGVFNPGPAFHRHTAADGVKLETAIERVEFISQVG